VVRIIVPENVLKPKAKCSALLYYAIKKTLLLVSKNSTVARTGQHEQLLNKFEMRIWASLFLYKLIFCTAKVIIKDILL
jgi:hypothetical protein